jgi:hypothetical protein
MTKFTSECGPSALHYRLRHRNITKIPILVLFIHTGTELRMLGERRIGTYNICWVTLLITGDTGDH